MKYIQHIVDATEKKSTQHEEKVFVLMEIKREANRNPQFKFNHVQTHTHSIYWSSFALTVNCVYITKVKKKLILYRTNTEKKTHKNVENQERKKSKTEFLSYILHTHTHILCMLGVCVRMREKQPSIY